MAFFHPRTLVNVHDNTSSSSFNPLFRFLDDFENYSRGNGSTDRHHSRSITRTFNPKFDVKEIEGSYELHGELPGIEQKDVDIEFSDPYTITVKGRTQRSYTAVTPPAGQLEDAAPKAAITESGEHNNHHATVEDENDTPVATPNTASSELATQHRTVEQKKPEEPKAKYWVSERSVGEFSRTFTFPVRVDTEEVTASMKNGILSITIPKSKKPEARKVTIN